MKTANYDLVLDTGWQFCLGEVNRFSGTAHANVYNSCKAGSSFGSKRVFLTENPWRSVRVPHDWLTELPYDESGTPSGGYKKRGCGWYYVKFDLPEAPIERARLVFEGVLGQTTVYVNGTVAGRNFSGYNRFTCEIASYLLPGEENMIVLYVDASTWEGWSYEGAGLYRPVYIEFREETRLDTYDCFVRGRETDGSWAVVADLSVLGLFGGENGAVLAYRLEDPTGNVLAETELPAENKHSVSIPVQDARLWSPECPTLYRFTCVLKRDGEVLDSFRTSVGLRSLEWRADAGVLLNGAHYSVKGVCCHQDHGGVGAAVTPELVEYRIARLKAIGVNAYRCAHHAVPDSFLEVCDRLGMLVMVENRHYSVCEDALKQLESLVRIARNHPSVFIYSLFNEEPWQGDRRGYLMAREMREAVRSLDDTRAVTGAMNGGTLTEQNASDAMDVIGMNYGLKHYEATHRRSPGKVILATENCPTYATRGEYVTDAARQIYASYGDDYAKSFSESMTETMERMEAAPYLAGSFVFSGIDAYGEPQPHAWPSVMSHWGMLDICGFPKDTAYLLAAWYKEELCAHLLPHWNHKADETVRVAVFTNADTAELFLNGCSLGEKTVKERRAEWSVPFTPGVIRVCARRGSETVFDEVRTAGAPARLVLEDETPEHGEGTIRIVNIGATDADGVPIPDFDRTVCFDVNGLEILGAANGDPTGHQPNVCDEIALFHGRAQLIVTGGEGSVTAMCDGLSDAVLRVGR